MKFCEKCGSYMQRTTKGFSCVKCGNEIQEQVVEVRRMGNSDRSSVDVVAASEAGYVRVAQRCPRCGNPEAYRLVSVVSGEHAGVRQERSIERLRCTNCSHSWTRS